MSAKKRKPHWSDVLVSLCACDTGLRWARRQPTLAAAWLKCSSPDHMQWLLDVASRDAHYSDSSAYEALCAWGGLHGGAACDAIRSIARRPTLRALRTAAGVTS